VEYECIPGERGDFEVTSFEVVETNGTVPGTRAAYADDDFAVRLTVDGARREKTRSIIALVIVLVTLLLVGAYGVSSMFNGDNDGMSRAIAHLLGLAGFVLGYYFGRKS
jgi:hypothetical protein